MTPKFRGALAAGSEEKTEEVDGSQAAVFL